MELKCLRETEKEDCCKVMKRGGGGWYSMWGFWTPADHWHSTVGQLGIIKSTRLLYIHVILNFIENIYHTHVHKCSYVCSPLHLISCEWNWTELIPVLLPTQHCMQWFLVGHSRRISSSSIASFRGPCCAPRRVSVALCWNAYGVLEAIPHSANNHCQVIKEAFVWYVSGLCKA